MLLDFMHEATGRECCPKNVAQPQGKPPCVWLLLLIGVSTMMLFGGFTSEAANVFFVPGDAFFHAKMTREEIVDSLSSPSTLRLAYAPPSHEVPSWGGFLGVSSLDIDIHTPLSRAMLVAAFDNCDTSDKQQEHGEKMGVFVYNKGFDLGQHRLCVKYNENWRPRQSQDPVQIKLRRSIRYSSFVPTFEAVVEDWGNAVDIPGLQVETDIERATILRGEAAGVLAKAAIRDIMIVIVLKGSYSSCFSKSDDACLVIVRDGDVKVLRFVDGQAVARPARAQ